jgi:hypothetical protein
MTGDLESCEVIGGAASVTRQHARESSADHAQRSADGAFGEWDSPGLQRKIERPAHPRNPKFLGETRDRVEDRGQQVRVLVGIEMCGSQTRIRDARDLPAKFIVNMNALERNGSRKLRDRRRKRVSADQHQVAANIERRIFTGKHNRVVELGAGRHERGRRQNPVLMRFDDAAVDVASESEVVGVYD